MHCGLDRGCGQKACQPRSHLFYRPRLVQALPRPELLLPWSGRQVTETFFNHRHANMLHRGLSGEECCTRTAEAGLPELSIT
jgi:hypothetical protein